MSADRPIEITSSINSPPLSGLVSSTAAGRLAEANLFRRYAGSLIGRFRIGGHEETVHKRVLYEIGIVTDVRSRMMRNGASMEDCFSQAVSTSEYVMTELIGACRRYTATPPSFNRIDLSAVGEKLGRALATYVQTGMLTCGDLRGNKPLNIRTISLRDSPINPAIGEVMVSRSVDTVGAGVFAVLAAAANGSGSAVFTDEITVDGNNRVQLAEPVGAQCALSCVLAMHVLLSMYEDFMEGTTMAYAIMRGCHAVATVVGHSDEGGYMRDCLRTGGFLPPYGGVVRVGTGLYTGLPMPTVTNESTFVAVLDSILLGTAGLFARADPLVRVGSNYYPTIFTAYGQPRMEAGAEADATEDMQNDIATQIAMGCHAMTSNYMHLLGELFMTSGGSVAAGHLQRSIVATGGTRHTRYATVAPYFWIEPTTLYKNNGSSLADANGYGIIAGTRQSSVMPYFEQVMVTHSMSTTYMAAVKQRTLRTSGIVIALMDNPLNGLGAMVPTQFLTDRAAMKGGMCTFAEAMARGYDLARYHWRRQQNSIPHPAAFIYTGTSIGIRITPVMYSEDDNMFRTTHAPTEADLEGEIVWVSRAPIRLENKPMGYASQERDVRRARSTAIESLANARLSTQTYALTGGEVMAVGNYEPLTFFSPSEINAIAGEAVRGGRGPVVPDDPITVGPRAPMVRMLDRQRVQEPRPAGRLIPGGLRRDGPVMDVIGEPPNPAPAEHTDSGEVAQPGPDEA